MLRIVGIVVVVVVLLLIAFAAASRYGWNPLDRIATPPAPTTTPAVPPTVVA